MTLFKNYLENEIEALEAAPSGASVPDYSSALNGQVLTVSGVDAANAKWHIDPGFAPTGGTWTITVAGDTTAPLAFDASTATIQAALEALGTVGLGNVVCLFNLAPDGDAVIAFQGNLAAQPVTLSADGSGLTGPNAPWVLVAQALVIGSPAGPKTLVWATP